MTLTDNPMTLNITGDITVSATLKVDALASGTLNLKIGEYYLSNEMPDDIENISLYGYSFAYSMGGSITNNTTGVDFQTLIVQDVWYEFGYGGSDYTEASIGISGNYSGHKLTIYDANTDAILFPETTMNYYSNGNFSVAISDTGALIDLLRNNIGKTISLKIVIR